MRCGLSVFQPPKSATIKLTHYRVLAIALNCSWLMDRSECPRAKDDGLTVENGRGRRSLATRRPLIARYAARRGNVSVRPNRTTATTSRNSNERRNETRLLSSTPALRVNTTTGA